MSESYKDILSHLSTEVDLQGKLSEEKKHEVEKILLQNEFEDEALEGLQEFKDKEQLQYMTEMLDRDLKKKTEKKKKRREKLQLKDQPWLYISILILLLLIVLSYLVIRKRLG
jgi:asparagine synthetase B (glutamine-hydrolysing)